MIPIAGSSPDELSALRERCGISLTDGEMRRLVELLGRDPTLVELHIFNTMWSEHCSYKSSRQVLQEHLPTTGPTVVLGPGEDAGIVRFHSQAGKSYCLVMAHESHNHPSQVLPVEGAATGIGGIVRDVYCMGADVVGVLDPLRFGDPDGPAGGRVRAIALGVVEGIAQYANALGVPNMGGDTYFHRSFDDNCLVNVVALGVVEEGDIVRSRVPEAARSVPYGVVLVGKPTDASGFGGAAFASERLGRDEVVEKQEAVQVPDPFLKRVLVEATKVVLSRMRRQGIAVGFKDLGAGGISCAVSEMAAAAGLGARLDLDTVPCAPPDLPSEIIACSETQERFALVVPLGASDEVCSIYNEEYELPGLYTGAGAVVIGKITDDGLFRMVHRGRVVCAASVEHITSGVSYRRPRKKRRRKIKDVETGSVGVGQALLRLLASDNVASKELVFRRYDTEVQGRAVLRPGEADAAVQVFLPGARVGLAVAVGGNSALAERGPYWGGVWSVVEAVRNVCCVGARPVAVTDCLNFGDPEDPEVFDDFSQVVRGIGVACRSLTLGGEEGIPVISGNVSFYNQSTQGRPIAPSPIVACAGKLEDLAAVRGMDLRQEGSGLFLVGRLLGDLGGSEYERLFLSGYHRVPEVNLAEENLRLAFILDAIRSGLVLSAHDISHGGVLVALAEMVVVSRSRGIGCRVEIGPAHGGGQGPVQALLFGEYGGIIVEVPRGREEAFLAAAPKGQVLPLGETVGGGGLEASFPGGKVQFTSQVLQDALRGDLGRVFGTG